MQRFSVLQQSEILVPPPRRRCFSHIMTFMCSKFDLECVYVCVCVCVCVCVSVCIFYVCMCVYFMCMYFMCVYVFHVCVYILCVYVCGGGGVTPVPSISWTDD